MFPKGSLCDDLIPGGPSAAPGFLLCLIGHQSDLLSIVNKLKDLDYDGLIRKGLGPPIVTLTPPTAGEGSALHRQILRFVLSDSTQDDIFRTNRNNFQPQVEYAVVIRSLPLM